MNIPIGATIRRLRSHRHITQEQLAAYLGVTPQAVSRWEAGNGYPDMETLPALSDYFSISADELLGIRKEGREERLEEIKKGAKRLAEIGAWEEQLEFARQAVAEFPSEEELQLNLAQVLQGAVREEQLDKSYLDEAEKILRTLLDTTSDDERRCKVMESLVEYYAIELKDSRRALEMADRLPKMKYCREFVKSNYLRDENGVYYIQDEIDRLTDALGCALQHLMESDDEAGWDEKIHMVQASTALYRMIYGDDLKFYHCRISWNAWLLSICLIAQDKKEETLASLEEMCRHAAAYDEAYVHERGRRYSSPLVNRLIYPESSEEFHEWEEHSHCWYMLNRLKNARYDGIRQEERFTAVVEELKRYAR